jgi:hypothetical protein
MLYMATGRLMQRSTISSKGSVKHGITMHHIFTGHVFSRGQTTYVRSVSLRRNWLEF